MSQQDISHHGAFKMRRVMTEGEKERELLRSYFLSREMTSSWLTFDTLGCLFEIIITSYAVNAVSAALPFARIAAMVAILNVALLSANLAFIYSVPSLYPKYRLYITAAHKVRALALYAWLLAGGHYISSIAAALGGARSARFGVDLAAHFLVILHTAVNGVFFALPWSLQLTSFAFFGAANFLSVSKIARSMRAVASAGFSQRLCHYTLGLMRHISHVFVPVGGEQTSICTPENAAEAAATFMALFFGCALPLCISYWHEQSLLLAHKRSKGVVQDGACAGYKIAQLLFWAGACSVVTHVVIMLWQPGESSCVAA